MKIHTIIFDFGNVLVKDTVELFENRHGWQKLSARAKAAHEKNIRACELGQISPRELMKRTSRLMAPQMSATQIEYYLEHHSKILPPFWLIPKLQKHYQVLILSNNFKGWPNKMWRALKVKAPRVPFINSSVIKARKQNGKAFKYIIKKYHLNPPECVFIDDHNYNLWPAKNLGFRTYLYRQDYSKFISHLKKLGVQGL